MHPVPLSFPPGFVWGVATAAAQIEGAAFEGGKGPSGWDDYARQPGRVHNGDNLDVACDHYHRYEGDFALMRSLGIRHYRLSIAWPRILPDGGTTVNGAGVDFYHRLFEAMARHGITPWVTMYHWDTPLPLEKLGGWRHRGIVDAFARYADVIVQAFHGEVKNWITLNEIPCFTSLAYNGGLDKSPGIRETAQVINQTIHHAIVCHGHGVRAVREHGGPGARVGLTDNTGIFIPVEETAPDIAAARQATVRDNERILGAIAGGGYSDAYLDTWGTDRAVVTPGDFDLVSLPTDFLGQNVYYGQFVRASGDAPDGYEVLPFPPGYPATTLSGWLKTTPQAIYWGTRFAAELFGAKAIYITENGYGADETPDANGEVLDLHRRDYLRQYLLELRRAIGDGVPVEGYFAWSFMDNFEWADGYSVRFGLCHTDYRTQQRTPKLSARWFSRVLTENRIV